MNILRKAFGYMVRPFTLRDRALPGRQSTSHAGELVTADSALALSAVWGCVNLLAGTIASLPIEMQRKGKSGAPEVFDGHDLARVLRDSPNADQTPVNFWQFACLSLELWGNAYARIERGSAGRVVALEPVRPDIVTVRRLASGELEYRWSEDGLSWAVSQSDMLHVRGFGGHALGGLSTLSFARNTFGLAAAIDRAAGQTFANGLQPTIALKFEKWLTPEQRAAVDDDMAEKYIGARNAGRPVRLEGGVGIQTLNINPEDAQMLESRRFSVEEVCRWFGVPPFMIGHTSTSTSWGSGLEQQVLGFQKFALRPRLKNIEQAIRKQLLSSEDRAAGISVSFNVEALLRGDTAARATFYGAMLQSGVMTINEVRALEGLAPVPGGDVPRMQSQNVPITQAAGMGHNGGPPL